MTSVQGFYYSVHGSKTVLSVLVVNLPLPPVLPNFWHTKSKKTRSGDLAETSFSGSSVWVLCPSSPSYALRRPFSGNCSWTPKCRYYTTLRRAQVFVPPLLEQKGGEEHMCLRLRHSTLVLFFADNVRRIQNCLSI